MLTALAQSLEVSAPGPILTLRCMSGHPVYILINERIPPGDVMYNWTTTNLPLLEIGLPISDSTRQKCIAMLYTLEAHGLGLPLPAALQSPYSDAIETCALVRGYVRFLQDHHVTPFLPTIPSPVQSLVGVIHRSMPSLAIHAGHRLAAVMLQANMFPTLRVQSKAALAAYFPGVESTTSLICTADARAAADEMMRWIGVSSPSYSYRRDRGASAKKARVHPLHAVFDAVFLTTRTNRKEFNVELEHLQKYMWSQWEHPYINVNHDRTIPPVAIVLGAHISRTEDEGVELYELHGRIATLNERGTKLLPTKGGLSVAFHQERQ